MDNAPEPSATPGRLITVVGIDGAGKSTLAAALCDTLNSAGQHTILVGKRTVTVDSDDDLSQYLDAVNAVVYRRKASVGAACGDRYWLFALAAWYSLQDRLVIQPALRAGTHVILDNAYHKILARYAVHPEVPTELAHQVFAHLTEPDIILFLQIDPEEALRRKGEFTLLETGRSGSSGQNFVAYQNKVTAELDGQQATIVWAPIDVTTKDRETVLDAVLVILAERGILQVGNPAASR